MSKYHRYVFLLVVLALAGMANPATFKQVLTVVVFLPVAALILSIGASLGLFTLVVSLIVCGAMLAPLLWSILVALVA